MKGCGREDLQKRKDLSLECKSEWVMENPLKLKREFSLYVLYLP